MARDTPHFFLSARSSLDRPRGLNDSQSEATAGACLEACSIPTLVPQRTGNSSAWSPPRPRGAARRGPTSASPCSRRPLALPHSRNPRARRTLTQRQGHPPTLHPEPADEPSARGARAGATQGGRSSPERSPGKGLVSQNDLKTCLWEHDSKENIKLTWTSA